MKKILVIAILIVGSVVSLSAQKLAKGGIKVGLNNSLFRGDSNGGFESKIGLNAGLFVEFPVSESFAISPELLYSEQGSEFKTIDSSGGAIESDYAFTYLSIPIMFKYYVSEKFNIQAGPQVSFLIKSDFEVKDSSGTVTVDAEELFDTPTADFGINIGVGYQITEKFFVDGRYSYGLSDLGEDLVDLQNSVFQISLGYRLD